MILLKKKLQNTFKNKKILVTGGTGFIGSEIVRSLLKYEPKVVRIFSNDEDATFNMSQELGKKGNKRFLVGDIRDKDRLCRAMEDIDIVYHAAALKHVPLCEYGITNENTPYFGCVSPFTSEAVPMTCVLALLLQNISAGPKPVDDSTTGIKDIICNKTNADAVTPIYFLNIFKRPLFIFYF